MVSLFSRKRLKPKRRLNFPADILKYDSENFTPSTEEKSTDALALSSMTGLA